MRTPVQKLRDERDEARVSQQELAQAMGIGRSELSTLLSGKVLRTVDQDFAKRYRIALRAIVAQRDAALSPQEVS